MGEREFQAEARVETPLAGVEAKVKISKKHELAKMKIAFAESNLTHDLARLVIPMLVESGRQIHIEFDGVIVHSDVPHS